MSHQLRYDILDSASTNAIFVPVYSACRLIPKIVVRFKGPHAWNRPSDRWLLQFSPLIQGPQDSRLQCIGHFTTSFLVLYHVPSLPQAKTREPTRWANHIRSEESHIPDLLNQHNVSTHDLISLLAMAVLDIHAVATKHQQNSSPQTFIVTCQMKLGSRNRFLHHWKRTRYDILTGRVCSVSSALSVLAETLNACVWLTGWRCLRLKCLRRRNSRKMGTHTLVDWLVVS